MTAGSESTEEIMSSTSSAYYHRQTEPTNVTGYYEIPPPSHVIDITEEPRVLNFPSGTTKIHKSVLNTLVKDKREDEYENLGGVNGIKASLFTDENSGINGSTEDILSRTEAYGTNTFLVPPTKSFFHFVVEALKNITLVILLVCGAILLGFGVKAHGVKQGCINGGSIFFAVLVVISISAICNFGQYRKLDKHFRETKNIRSQVVRYGIQLHISMSEIVVGDIVCLYIGDHVPADGLFIKGRSLLVEESSTGADDTDPVPVNHNQNPFLFSGNKVVDGNAKMVVTCVGMKSSWGEKMIRNYKSDEKTPLQTQLNELSSSFGKYGISIALVVLVVLLLWYIIGNKYKDEFNVLKYENVIDAVVGIIAVSLAIVVVSVPDGLPLAFKIAILCSMKRMMADNAMVRTISACETMGSIKSICVDIIGTLSSNKMTVTVAYISSTTESMEGKSYTDIPPNVCGLFIKGVSLLKDSVENRLADINIDDAIFQWACLVQNIETDLSLTYTNVMEPSCFEKNRIGILVKGRSDKNINVYWRGDAETIISSCSHYFDSTGSTMPLDEQERGKIQQLLENMATSGLLCIAYAYKRLTRAERENIQTEIPGTGLALLGYVGLKFHHQPGTKEAVEICRGAGINVKMITTENVFIATAIAKEYGIFSSDDQELVVKGVEFSNYTEEERKEKLEKICVMASSSPLDKLLMVNCLKNIGDVVGVIGDSIKDALALSEADIGIAIGGDEVTKQSSDIVILNDNFASMAKALRWGRGVYHNIRKFIQFQVTVNVVALVINVVVVASSGELALTTVQLLWVNIIMDTLGAIALASEKPCKEIMSVPPVCRTESLITNVMWRNIISQASYQIAVILFFRFNKVINESIFRAHEIVFTSFVLLQVSNLFNARKIQKKNVFEGLFGNKSFLVIIGITITLQVVMMEVLNKFVIMKRLDWKEWGLCVGFAVLSWPIGYLVKFIPVPESLNRMQG